MQKRIEAKGAVNEFSKKYAEGTLTWHVKMWSSKR
jgi:hypothetical protein